MGMRLFVVMMGAALVAVPLACSDPGPRPPVGEATPDPVYGRGGGGGANDSGARDGAAGGSDGGEAGADAGPQCTTLPITGGIIDQLSVQDTPPPATGGTVVDGIYDLTEARVYNPAGLPGNTGNSYQATIRVLGQTSFERAVIFRNATNAVSETRETGTFKPGAVVGNATIGLTCPTALQEQVTYTATENKLTITNNTTGAGFTFTRKP